ncbi:MAG: gliding motility-associated C-terminal domain-containing protein, partial [Flavobacteriales bacterium]|nr:gliding motility-associated C-terminal domain-containing protein [Flavobacteriales bacterium]
QTGQTATGLCAGIYSVDVTDNTGCVASGTITVTSGAAIANATITAAGPFCESGGIVTLSAVDPGGTWSGTGITNAATGTFDPAIATAIPGSYIITYTIPGVCGAVDTETIVVNADADATITPAGPFCLGDPSLTLMGATAGGTWSGLGITNTTTGVFDPVVAGSGSHVITYSVGGPCPDVQTTTILINSSFDATITPAGPFCESNGVVTLAAVDFGGNWSGTGITNGLTGTFDPAIAGPGTFLITYLIPGGCGSTDTENITVNADGDATITPAGPFCAGDPATTLVGATLGGVWSGTGITNTTTGTFDPALAGLGTYTITYSVGGACPDVQTFDVIVNNTFDATISGVIPFCESNPALNLTAVDPGGIWSGTGITDPVLGTFDPTTATAGTWTITYTIPGGCGGTDTESVMVIPDADATISATGPYCDIDPATPIIGVGAGGVWSGIGITDPAMGTFDPATAGPGTHTITYTISGACGDVDTEDIIVSAQMDATITSVGPYCEADPVIAMTGVDIGGTWSGTGITDPALGTFNPMVAGPGIHTITYDISGSCGDLKTTTITVNQNMDATISPVGPYCEGETSVGLIAVDLGGTWSGIGIVDVVNGVFDPATAGVGNWTITYSIPGMCGDLKTTEIIVIPNLDATITSVGPFCEDAGSIIITAANPGGTWSGLGISSGTSGAFDPVVAGPGTTSIIYTISGGCGNADTTTILINPLPVVSFTADQLVGCEPLGVNFTNTSIGSVNCSWDYGGAGTSANCAGDSITFSVGIYDVSLTITDGNGCTNTLVIPAMITSNAYPVAEFSFGPQPTTILNPIIDFTNLSTGGNSYQWDFDGLGGAITLDASFSFPDTGSYNVQLVVTSVAGCSDSITYPVIIGPELLVYIPTGFTPDGDGVNDFFLPSVIGYLEDSYQFMVFDRWGAIIFNSELPNVGWDGMINNQMAKTDVYVWKLVIKGETTRMETEYKGHVTLLR